MSQLFPAEVWSHARRPRSVFRYFSYQRIGAFTVISDFALIVAASIATGIVYHFLAFDDWGDIDAFVVIGCYSGLTFVLLSKLLGLYQPNVLLSAARSNSRHRHRLERGRPVYDVTAVLAENRGTLFPRRNHQLRLSRRRGHRRFPLHHRIQPAPCAGQRNAGRATRHCHWRPGRACGQFQNRLAANLWSARSRSF